NFTAAFRVDIDPPTITCPGDITTVSVDAGLCSSVVTYSAPVGIDNFPGAITTQTAGLSSGSAFPVGTTTNTFLVTDAAGNTATCSFDVTVVDDEVPTPDVATLANVTAQCEVTTLTPPTATDNCTAVTVSSNASLPITTQGTTVVTWTYADANGNSSTQTQNVIITDTTAPVADVATLANVTAQCEVTSLTQHTSTDHSTAITVSCNASLPITTQ